MVFTNQFELTPTKVLFDRICRDNVIKHLLTALATPTRNGKIERVHRTLQQSSSPRGFPSRSQQCSASSTPESRTTTSGHRVPPPP
jgi:transposase InsO family protein